MKIGEKIQATPHFMRNLKSPEKSPKIEGTVVYIHPKRRYVTLEFICKYGRKFREAFQLR